MTARDLPMPAQNIEAEQAVLGSLLLSPDSWDLIADIITDADFYRDDHRRIFRAIRTLVDSGKPADVLTVSDALTLSNEIQLTGGLAYLGDIANSAPAKSRVKAYAQIVLERRLMRDLQAAAGDIETLAYAGGQETAQERIDSAQGLLLSLAESRPNQREPKAIGTVLVGVIDDLQARFDSDLEISGLSSGFTDLDRKTSGLQQGDLIILAGRPSMGKTALALNIAENVALADKPVMVFSLEMGDKQLASRSLSSLGGISMERVRNGRLLESDWDGVSIALGKLSSAPLIIDESSSPTVSQMRARSARQKRKDGLGLVVIDYLQLMSTGNRQQNRNEDLSEITRGLKLMAKDLGCPVILLSQLSRKCEERTNKRPLMSDLRESGAIEQDADLILMLYRDEQYNPESPFKGFAEVIIRKQRMGPTGDLKLVFEGEYSRFRDADHQAIAEAAQRAHEAKPISRKRGFSE